jgi:uncharacterized lipoprotein YehR (DUF1307 family)
MNTQELSKSINNLSKNLAIAEKDIKFLQDEVIEKDNYNPIDLDNWLDANKIVNDIEDKLIEIQNTKYKI